MEGLWVQTAHLHQDVDLEHTAEQGEATTPG